MFSLPTALLRSSFALGSILSFSAICFAERFAFGAWHLSSWRALALFIWVFISLSFSVVAFENSLMVKVGVSMNMSNLSSNGPESFD